MIFIRRKILGLESDRDNPLFSKRKRLKAARKLLIRAKLRFLLTIPLGFVAVIIILEYPSSIIAITCTLLLITIAIVFLLFTDNEINKNQQKIEELSIEL